MSHTNLVRLIIMDGIYNMPLVYTYRWYTTERRTYLMSVPTPQSGLQHWQ